MFGSEALAVYDNVRVQGMKMYDGLYTNSRVGSV